MITASLLLTMIERLWVNMWAIALPMTLCVVTLCLVEYTWRELSPAVRSWLWRLFFVKCALGLGGIALIETNWLADGWPSSRSIASVEPAANAPSTKPTVAANASALPVNDPASIGQATINRSASSLSFGASLRTILFIAWLIGIAIGAVMMLSNFGKLTNVLWHSPLKLPAEFESNYHKLARRLNISRPPQLRLVTMLSAPALTYCGRTRVLLPKSFAENYGAAAVDMALAHELAHWSRRDIFWNWLASLVGLVCFAFPPMWIALQRYRLAQEMACDAWALQRGRISPAEYAGMLLKVVERTAIQRSSAALSIASLSLARTESFRTLKERLNAMKPVRSPQVVRGLASLLLIGSLIGLALPWHGSASADEPPKARKSKPRLQVGGSGDKYATPTPAPGGATASAFSYGQAFSSGGASGGGNSYGGGNSFGGTSQGFVTGGGFAAVGTPVGQASSLSPGSASASSAGGLGSGSALSGAGFPMPMSQMKSWSGGNMVNGSPNTSVSTASQMIDGEQITVTTVLDKQREITIRQSDSEGVEVRIRQRGKKAAVETVTADSLADLEKDSPAIYKQIAPYIGKTAFKSGLDAEDKDEPLPGPGAAQPNPAQQMLRDQLRQLREQAAGNEQLQSLIDQMIKQQQ